jgi:hypothetical protein
LGPKTANHNLAKGNRGEVKLNETVSKDRATALIVLVLGLTVLLISACQSGETAAVAGINEVTLAPSFQNATQATPSAAFQVGPVSDYPTLVDALRAAGANVELDGEISQPFFPLPGQLITVEGGEVQVFEFESESAAEGEAALVSPDGGSVGTSAMS